MQCNDKRRYFKEIIAQAEPKSPLLWTWFPGCLSKISGNSSYPQRGAHLRPTSRWYESEFIFRGSVSSAFQSAPLSGWWAISLWLGTNRKVFLLLSRFWTQLHWSKAYAHTKYQGIRFFLWRLTFQIWRPSELELFLLSSNLSLRCL